MDSPGIEHLHEFTLMTSEVGGKKIAGPTPNVEPWNSLDLLQQITQPSTPPLSVLPQEQTTSPPQSARSSKQPSDGYTNISAATEPVFPDDRANRSLSAFESANKEPPGSISPMVLPDEMLSLWTPPSRFACQQQQQQQQTLPPPSESRAKSLSLLHRELLPSESREDSLWHREPPGSISPMVLPDEMLSLWTPPSRFACQQQQQQQTLPPSSESREESLLHREPPHSESREEILLHKEPQEGPTHAVNTQKVGDIGDTLKSFETFSEALSVQSKAEPKLSTLEKRKEPAQPSAAQEDAASNRTTLQPDTTPPDIQLSMPTMGTISKDNSRQAFILLSNYY